MRRFLALALIVVLASPAKGAMPSRLQPGRYEVSVRLDLPNVEGAPAAKVTTFACQPRVGSAITG